MGFAWGVHWTSTENWSNCLGFTDEKLAAEEQSGSTARQELIRVSSEDANENHARRAEAAEARAAALETDLVAERQARVQAELAAAAVPDAAAAAAPATEDAAVLMAALEVAEAAVKAKDGQIQRQEAELQAMEEMMMESQAEMDLLESQTEPEVLNSPPRDLLLMVAPNETVEFGRKLRVSCGDMTTLNEQVAQQLSLTAPIVIAAAIATGESPVPYLLQGIHTCSQTLQSAPGLGSICDRCVLWSRYADFNSVPEKAKIQVWPAGLFASGDSSEILRTKVGSLEAALASKVEEMGISAKDRRDSH